MPDERTPHWLPQLKFFLLCSPVGIVLALILAPFALPILLAFGGTLFLFWQGSRLFTNGFVKLFDPQGYESIKRNGGDPFYDSLGAPLNNDSEQVRVFGHEPNTFCPGCEQPIFLEMDTPFQCPTCGAYWHENNWWRWTGEDWVNL